MIIPALEEERDLKSVVRAILGAAIWIPYFKRSVRVRNTFIH